MAQSEIDERDVSSSPTQNEHLATPPTLMVDETLMRLARDNRRDEEDIMRRISHELQKNAKFADELFYSIPYKNNRQGLITFVEGPSIRAAEHLWSRWGNCTVAARVADDRGNKIMVQGLYLDHENGLRLFSDMEVNKMATTRAGGTYPLSANDLRIKVAATESKAKRNVFISALPVWIKDGYKEMCFDLSMGQSQKPVNERIVDAKLFFMSKFKIEENAILNLIEKVRDSYPGIDDKSILRYMIGIKNAIKDGNVDEDFVFGEQKQTAAMPQPKSAKDNGDGKSE